MHENIFPSILKFNAKIKAFNLGLYLAHIYLMISDFKVDFISFIMVNTFDILMKLSLCFP